MNDGDELMTGRSPEEGTQLAEWSAVQPSGEDTKEAPTEAQRAPHKNSIATGYDELVSATEATVRV